MSLKDATGPPRRGQAANPGRGRSRGDTTGGAACVALARVPVGLGRQRPGGAGGGPSADYDVVLMDVSMPIMDGLEATRQIRLERPSGTGLRIVGMSADTMAEDRQVCLSAGMNDFLAKPVDVDALIRILDETALGLAAVC